MVRLAMTVPGGDLSMVTMTACVRTDAGSVVLRRLVLNEHATRAPAGLARSKSRMSARRGCRKDTVRHAPVCERWRRLNGKVRVRHSALRQLTVTYRAWARTVIYRHRISGPQMKWSEI